MTRRTAHRLIRHPLLAALLLAALYARAMIPVGYMPGEGGLMLCPAYAPAGASPVHHDMGAGMHGTHGDTDHGMPGNPADDAPAPSHEASALCPFAAASASVAAPPVFPVVLGIVSEAPRAALARPPFVPRGTPVPTRLPRGPPISA